MEDNIAYVIGELLWSLLIGYAGYRYGIYRFTKAIRAEIDARGSVNRIAGGAHTP